MEAHICTLRPFGFVKNIRNHCRPNSEGFGLYNIYALSEIMQVNTRIEYQSGLGRVSFKSALATATAGMAPSLDFHKILMLIQSILMENL